MSQSVTAERVERIILGLEGPWADPRRAVDTLDNLAELWLTLDEDEARALAEVLLALLGHADPVVRSGAVCFLPRVEHHLSAQTLLAAYERCGPLLDAPVVQFADFVERMDDVLACCVVRRLAGSAAIAPDRLQPLARHRVAKALLQRAGVPLGA
jgi:hypothetical protein